VQCKQCGATIADNALICYRCGAPTTEAKYQPAVVGTRRTRSNLIWIIIAVLILLIVLIGAYALHLF